MTEDEVHKTVVKRIIYEIRRYYPELEFFHVPNGAYHGGRPWEGARGKALGVQSGIPDLILLNDGRNYALELKSESGRLSAAQNRWLKILARNGWETGVPYGLDDAMALLYGWFPRAAR